MPRPDSGQELHLLGQDARTSLDSVSAQDANQRSSRGPGANGTHNNASRTPSDHAFHPDSSNHNATSTNMKDYEAGRPSYHRHGDGRSSSGVPLLFKAEEGASEEDRGRQSMTERLYDGERVSHDQDSHSQSMSQRPPFSRQSTMRNRSPREVAAANAAKKKYTFAGFFLVVSLLSFCLQTELSAYIQHDLGWGKAYCMMYLTHGSWIVLWPAQLLILRLQKRDVPWSIFFRRHLQTLKSTAMMVQTRSLDVHKPSVQHNAQPIRYMIQTTAFVTTALTVAGLSWYIAVALTTPSDLTAIYNCSAFFAYVFSVPLLREPLRADKSVAVLIAIGGVLVVAYGDTKEDSADGGVPEGNPDTSAGGRFLGNVVIGVGSVLYGLYEVLYKRYACPPEGVSPGRGVIFANTFGALIGVFTLTILWIPLPILHWLDIERFEIPEASTCGLILMAVLANATFSGSFLVLISLTSPVLSSVAALLTIFMVAIFDWFRTGEPLSWAAIIGGTMIIIAFLGLSYSTYREIKEHEAQKLAVDLSDSDVEGDASSNDD